MRVLSLSFVVMITAATGCVSVPPMEPDRPPEVVYRKSRPLRQYHSPRMPARSPSPRRRPTTASWYPRGKKISNRWSTIVVHHSATDSGSAKSFDRFHREKRGWDELGYHFVIGNGAGAPDGLIEVGSRWHKQKTGAHCKTPSNYYNEHGIGVCLVGDFTKTKPTRRQLQALERLVRFLSHSCDIPPSRITTHGHVSRKTQCPGKHFPLMALRRAVSARPTAGVYR